MFWTGKKLLMHQRSKPVLRFDPEKTMKSIEIRQSFIDFFKNKEHQFVRSSSVAPLDDPTLLFTNAGMNQFKPVFLGEQDPDAKRVVNSQKCIRVSGKHNDLEEVGVDSFHHTFFEMLGNWSFGDYYKAEAIRWAWELFTEVWKLDKNRLWATVYLDDDEAFDLWLKETDIESDRVLRCGAKDNFWEMGETGPCGPCSEIHYFVGDDISDQTADGVNVSDQYWELWNLVFIQYNRDETGTLNELPAKHVDTGAGLERIVTVLQGKTSNYETDLFSPIISKIESLTGFNSKDNIVPFQVIADHIRMLSFSIADGAMPSNEGRGYVLRRILRRASRFGRMLDQHEPFIFKLVDTICEVMGDVYPELHEKRAHIRNVIKAEEVSFNTTLDRGINHFEKLARNSKGDIIAGKDAFRLYDTYGFPLDLTQLMAREKNLEVDVDGFEEAMQEQKSRTKASGKFTRDTDDTKWNIVSQGSDSQFRGYETLSTESTIVKWAITGDEYKLILDSTPFYAESGGQVGDTGTISGDGIELVVKDTVKDGESFVHICTGEFDENKTDQTISCKVDHQRRNAIRKNHTATHLVNAALREVLGEHVHQAGSQVHPDNFRFDLTHFEKIKDDELLQIEQIVNRKIADNIQLDISIIDYDEARNSGAQALFGEKYGDKVRVITVNDFSKELCGGTHVERTGDIGYFKIIEETALAAGVRRIVGITADKAVEYNQNQSRIINELQLALKCTVDDLPDRLNQLLLHKKELEKQVKRRQSGGINFKSMVSTANQINGMKVIIEKVDSSSMDELKGYGDDLLSALDSGIGVLGMKGEKKPSIVVVVTKDLVEKGFQAGMIARELGRLMGGGGGGKAHLATAGGRENKDLEMVMDKGLDKINELLKAQD